jgi:hypothetical protein
MAHRLMAGLAAIVVSACVVGEPELAIWCGPCALPSAAEATLLITIGQRTTLERFRRCGNCGRQTRIA